MHEIYFVIARVDNKERVLYGTSKMTAAIPLASLDFTGRVLMVLILLFTLGYSKRGPLCMCILTQILCPF